MLGARRDVLDDPAADAHEGPSRSAAEAVRPTVEAPERVPSRLTPLCLALSFALHGGAFAAGAAWVRSNLGAIERPSEAISVELAETTVLEAVHESSIPNAARSDASTAPHAGEPVPEAIKSMAASEVKQAELLPVEEMRPADDPDEIAVIEGAAPEDAPQAAREIRRKAKPDEPARKERERKDRQREAARPAGGATSKATTGSAPSAGRVSASTGDILGYAARVRARVAGNKPAGAGRRGTVVVAFGVTKAGGLSYATVARSSGDAGLDRSVLSAVRGAAPFPAPPVGASQGQLRFSIPFHFR